MTIPTGGPIRGLMGRWVMRLEASGQLLSMAFQGTTAMSALTGVLAYTGYGVYVPYFLAAGALSVVALSYSYVELGIYNRKNKEKQDRGNNFAKPQNIIDDAMIARAIHAATEERELTKAERDAISRELQEAYTEYKNGVDV